jgi:hypothetical protein
VDFLTDLALLALQTFYAGFALYWVIRLAVRAAMRDVRKDAGE